MSLALGLFSMTTGPCSHPDGAARVASAAEAAGFESLWGGEHVVLPDPRVPPSPLEPEDRITDPIVTLAFLAAHTRRIRLGTGIIILPQRNPLVLAKQLATLDVLSGGRLIFGVGVGYLEPEFRALGIPFETRGAVTDEYLAAIRTIWTERQPEHRGRFVTFAGVQAHPRPAQQPSPPIVIGGHTEAAFRRAVQQGHGWYGFALDEDGVRRCLDGLRAAAERHPRPAGMGPLEISVTPRPTRGGEAMDRASADRFAALGVHRLIVIPPRSLDAAGLERFVEKTARELRGLLGGSAR
ncbi:MAG TPA: LLM class F420-dependent oxidoreductase [Methylomirabilota bacterium]|nr:LLM class F420-dependent oxidoreductase [Methylomirabilota bacterium]